MKQITFSIDYTYCPKGHGDWIFIGSTTMCYDVFWCEKCDCFYEPTISKVDKGAINKQFSSDRELELIKYAKFLKWKKSLSIKDMPKEIK